MSRAVFVGPGVLLAWVIGGALLVSRVVGAAAAPSAGAPTAAGPRGLLSGGDAVRAGRGVEPGQVDARLADPLAAQASGSISLSDALDRQGAMCEKSSWVVLTTGGGESLGVVLQRRAEAVVGAAFTRAAIDHVVAQPVIGDSYRVMFCRTFTPP